MYIYIYTYALYIVKNNNNNNDNNANMKKQKDRSVVFFARPCGLWLSVRWLLQYRNLETGKWKLYHLGCGINTVIKNKACCCLLKDSMIRKCFQQVGTKV